MANFVRLVTFIPRKMWNYTKSINTLLEAPTGIKEFSDKSVTYFSKITGATIGLGGAGKGAADMIEAYVCNDGVCFFISGVGVCADLLGFTASFVPGPNVTSIVTIPVSTCCKVFVWNCKRNNLPWTGCPVPVASIVKGIAFRGKIRSC